MRGRTWGRWDRWAAFFEDASYVAVTPGWPNDPLSVAEAHAHPEVFAGKGVGDVAAYQQMIIERLDRRPAVIGHSFGGVLVQILAGRGLSAATCAIDPAPSRGVLPLPLAALADEPMLILPRGISPAYSDAMVAACRAAGFAPRVVREVGSAMAQLGFVAAGIGVALVSAGMARLRPPGVAFRELEGPIHAVGVALAWNAERETEVTRLALDFAEMLFPGG